MMTYLLTMTLFPIPLAFADDGWLSRPTKTLCKNIRYEVSCQECEDGWSESRLIHKKTGEQVGRHYYAACGSGNNCGDSFYLEKSGKVKCEKFVEEIQKRHKKCGGCLTEILNSGG